MTLCPMQFREQSFTCCLYLLVTHLITSLAWSCYRIYSTRYYSAVKIHAVHNFVIDYVSMSIAVFIQFCFSLVGDEHLFDKKATTFWGCSEKRTVQTLDTHGVLSLSVSNSLTFFNTHASRSNFGSQLTFSHCKLISRISDQADESKCVFII